MSDPTIERVEFFFDTGCPWTWKTATWLLQTGVEVHWRAFRLEYLLDGPVPDQWAAAAEASAVALRLVESLAAQGRNDDIARFYVALGQSIHDRLEPQSPELIRTIGHSVGLSAEDLQALDDISMDSAVRASFNDATSLTGPGLGSPVLAVTFSDGRRRGMFGPILTGALSSANADKVWQSLTALIGVDQFAETKRGRSLYGELDASLTPHA
jgi:hypothetical protein